MKKNKLKCIGLFVLYLVLSALIAVSSIAFPLCKWYKKNIKVSIDAALFTLRSPLKGTNESITSDVINSAIPGVEKAVVIILILIAIELLIRKKDIRKKFKLFKKEHSINLKYVYRLALVVATFTYLGNAYVYADKDIGITKYAKQRFQSTKIFQEKYIDPNKVKIKPNDKVEVATSEDEVNTTSGQKTKNLIYIYVESYETSYGKKSEDGWQKEDIDLIPRTTELAKENVSFSTTNKMRGIRNTAGTDWTFGSIFASTSGIPFKFPGGVENSMNDRKKIASGVTTLGEILEKKGYYQEFMCGSDANFAGRGKYFKQHGNYNIFDLLTAKEKGLIPQDYMEGWGFEDEKLYQYAKDELGRISKKDQPFNFTMLTVDTHFPVGHRCRLCGDKYGGAGDIVECMDNQLADFIEWCKEQDFYDDTVIVIQGDHPRMDKKLIKGAPAEVRTVYNCFINSGLEPKLGEKKRVGTIMDMFPSTLAAMGFEVEGDRLGLGTNLFSDKKTLAEEMGFDNFDDELSKYSQYYVDKFS